MRPRPSRSAPTLRPAERAEAELLRAILRGGHAAGETLPAERELAAQLGVTRPTLREALARLAREGWISVRHGKPTLVNDWRQEGGLGVLAAVVRLGRELPPGFVRHLLEVRLALAPAYAEAAVQRDSDAVALRLREAARVPDQPAALAAYDWGLHRLLAQASGNPVFPLILNGFAGFYEELARGYFASPAARQASRRFFTELARAADAGNPAAARRVTQRAMETSLELWGEA
jgi:GntR family negative regulator for fad regulon and positive regulator of fabA